VVAEEAVPKEEAPMSLGFLSVAGETSAWRLDANAFNSLAASEIPQEVGDAIAERATREHVWNPSAYASRAASNYRREQEEASEYTAAECSNYRGEQAEEASEYTAAEWETWEAAEKDYAEDAEEGDAENAGG
jgi:hypothetical protein